MRIRGHQTICSKLHVKPHQCTALPRRWFFGRAATALLSQAMAPGVAFQAGPHSRTYSVASSAPSIALLIALGDAGVAEQHALAGFHKRPFAHRIAKPRISTRICFHNSVSKLP
jgi:hypothetical protein